MRPCEDLMAMERPAGMELRVWRVLCRYVHRGAVLCSPTVLVLCLSGGFLFVSVCAGRRREGGVRGWRWGRWSVRVITLPCACAGACACPFLGLKPQWGQRCDVEQQCACDAVAAACKRAVGSASRPGERPPSSLPFPLPGARGCEPLAVQVALTSMPLVLTSKPGRLPCTLYVQEVALAQQRATKELLAGRIGELEAEVARLRACAGAPLDSGS